MKVVLFGVCVAALALAAGVYANTTKRPARLCSHGESSTAVSIYGGHVKVIEPPTRTGCAP